MIITAILSSLLAVAVHIYLTIQHFQLKVGLAGSSAACNINATFNCDVTAISQYAVFMGVPIAIFGAMANFVLTVLLILSMVGLSENPQRIRRAAFLLATAIALVSLVMSFISSALLKTYCLYCMGTYVLSFISLVTVWKSLESNFTREIASDIFSYFTSQKWILALFALVPAGGFLVNAVLADNYQLSKIQYLVREKVENWKTAPIMNFNLETGLISQRSAEPAKMTIVEFADFKCPHCRMAYPTLHAFADGRTDVKFIFKSFPLDGTCNGDLSRKGDGSTCQLAFATFCAEKLSHKGWLMHNWIFDHQESFLSASSPDSHLREAAGDAGIDFNELKKCMGTSEIYDLVLNQAKEGASAKVQGTPTVFVNGKLLELGHLLPFLEAVYQEIK